MALRLGSSAFAANNVGNQRVGNAVAASQRTNPLSLAVKRPDFSHVFIGKLRQDVKRGPISLRPGVDVLPGFPAKRSGHRVDRHAKLAGERSGAVRFTSGFIAQPGLPDDLCSQFGRSHVLAFGLSVVVDSVAHVVQVRAFGEMGRITAGRVVADQMPDYSRRWSPMSKLERNSMGALGTFPRKVKRPVTVVTAACPGPASIGAARGINVRPKSFSDFFLGSSVSQRRLRVPTLPARFLYRVLVAACGRLKVECFARKIALTCGAFNDRLEAHVIPPESYAGPLAVPAAQGFSLPQLYLGGSHANH